MIEIFVTWRTKASVLELECTFCACGESNVSVIFLVPSGVFE